MTTTFEDCCQLNHGDSMEWLKRMKPGSADALITDPPAGIGFMGKAWDNHSRYDPVTRKGRLTARSVRRLGLADWEAGFLAFSVDWAVLAFDALKPGAHGVVWGLPRTSDLTMLALRIAGFEVRDVIEHLHAKRPRFKAFIDSLDPHQLQLLERAVGDDSRALWAYGSGFPKNHDVSKAIDKVKGAERKIVGSKLGLPGYHLKNTPENVYGDGQGMQKDAEARFKASQVTAPGSPEAQTWEGWGTALKPSQEPWVLVRKPLEGTVAENVLAHGTGAINIDASRVGSSGATKRSHQAEYPQREDGGEDREHGARTGHDIVEVNAGRWPANTVLEHTPECRQVGTRKVKGGIANDQTGVQSENAYDWNLDPLGHRQACGYVGEDGREEIPEWECAPDCPVGVMDEQSAAMGMHSADSGGASRFFNQFQLEGETFLYTAKTSRKERHLGLTGDTKNRHPTVKPRDLMEWLVRLVTPPGGTVIDPFMGSGSTGIAAVGGGWQFMGSERDEDSFEVAEQRIRYTWAREAL